MRIYSASIADCIVSKMWMCYSAEHWPKAIDGRTAVERLLAEMSDLEMDAVRSQNRIQSTSSLEFLQNLEEKYNKGVSLCETYLYQKSICIKCLIVKLAQCGLTDFLSDIRKYVEAPNSVAVVKSDVQSVGDSETDVFKCQHCACKLE